MKPVPFKPRPNRWDNRYWPTVERRPGESISDWCARLDTYANMNWPTTSPAERNVCA